MIDKVRVRVNVSVRVGVRVGVNIRVRFGVRVGVNIRVRVRVIRGQDEDQG